MTCTRRLGSIGGFIILMWGFVLPNAAAQSLFDLRGATHSTALGHATTARTELPGIHGNPAGWAPMENPSITLYAGQSYGLPELQHGTISIHWPSSLGHAAAGVGTFGTEAYRETYLSVGAARTLHLGSSRPLHLGTTVRYYHVAMSRFGNAAAVGIHAGMVMQIMPLVDVGVHATNINQPQWTDETPLPRTLSVGLAYRLTDRVTMSADLFNDVEFPMRFRSGIEATVIAPLTVYGGVQTTPSEFALGGRIGWKGIYVGVAAEQHWELGWSPAADLRITW